MTRLRLGDKLRDNERLIVLCGATFLVMAGQGIISPVLPLYAKEFGVGTTMVGMTVTAFALARPLLDVPAGSLADRFGRRLILIGGPIVTAIGMIGSGLADSIWELLAWRFVAGAGSALYMSEAMVDLIDVARPDQLTRHVATNQWALTLGVALGPGLGGLGRRAVGPRRAVLRRRCHHGCRCAPFADSPSRNPGPDRNP